MARTIEKDRYHNYFQMKMNMGISMESIFYGGDLKKGEESLHNRECNFQVTAIRKGFVEKNKKSMVVHLWNVEVFIPNPLM